ncbi:hypothetical protein AG1IA_02375 [Rhizoctonia solani AG-1 IA]|uniref:UBA domain-containing protein n=1 Tax=Thanatephorus cucumeris (strain AG1-IA) TaxID=983506 RepID=L8X3J3_THACA|nr:hypothetical protein AG1IA_02375 [Rhizoctonia solani AG-1 IA]
MASDRDQLIAMGFAPERIDCKPIVIATNNAGLQPAMDHILENDGKPVPDLTNVASTNAPAPTANEDDEELEALRAQYGGTSAAEAGKAENSVSGGVAQIFRDTALANFHAEKSGHDQFEESTEEIKPLTEEEKKQKLAELRTRMEEKRAAKAAEEAKEARANEVIRRKGGQDMGAIKEELQLKEAEKEARQRKQDKLDDAKAKAAVRAQIEADKKARAEKAAKEKALREGREYQQPPVSGVGGATSASAAAPGAKSSESPSTRLQIRLSSGGAPLTTTMASDSSSALCRIAKSRNLLPNCHILHHISSVSCWETSSAHLGNSLHLQESLQSIRLYANPQGARSRSFGDSCDTQRKIPNSSSRYNSGNIVLPEWDIDQVAIGRQTASPSSHSP